MSRRVPPPPSALVMIVASLLLAALPWAASAGGQELSADEEQAGFVALFNGRDFTGWRFGDESPPKELPANWKVEDGVIKVSGGGSPHLASAMEYGNFELRLQWRGVKEKYNSGLFLRSGMKVGANQINLAHRNEGAFLGGKVAGGQSGRRTAEAGRRVERVADRRQGRGVDVLVQRDRGLESDRLQARPRLLGPASGRGRHGVSQHPHPRDQRVEIEITE